MRVFLLLDLFFTLSTTTATLDSWPSSDDSLFANSDSTFDSPALPANELASTSSFQDGSPSLFNTDLLPENPETFPPGYIPWDLNNDSPFSPPFENLRVDDSFQLADCSASSENSPLFSKSRTRRNDSPGICKPKADSTPPDGTEELLDLGRLQRELDVRLNPVDKTKGALDTEEHNEFCFLFTVGVLPWGVCSSGNLADELLVVMDPITVNGSPQTLAYTLTHCTLSPGATATCPGRTLFCCRTYAGTDAQVCLPLYRFFKTPFPPLL